LRIVLRSNPNGLDAQSLPSNSSISCDFLPQKIGTVEDSSFVRKDGYVYDRQTLLHRNHIRDGSIGYGARVLNSEKLALIDAAMQEEGFESLLKVRGHL
jgi:hypothetical protein